MYRKRQLYISSIWRLPFPRIVYFALSYAFLLFERSFCFCRISVMVPDNSSTYTACFLSCASEDNKYESYQQFTSFFELIEQHHFYYFAYN